MTELEKHALSEKEKGILASGGVIGTAAGNILGNFAGKGGYMKATGKGGLAGLLLAGGGIALRRALSKSSKSKTAEKRTLSDKEKLLLGLGASGGLGAGVMKAVSNAGENRRTKRSIYRQLVAMKKSDKKISRSRVKKLSKSITGHVKNMGKSPVKTIGKGTLVGLALAGSGIALNRALSKTAWAKLASSVGGYDE